MEEAQLDSALSGIRVLEICEGLAGPVASMRMANQGAEVIKVEAPGGDPASDEVR